MAHNLLNLPNEVLHRILTNVDPSDLARLCCCRALGSFIKGDRLLWKELYLKNFDNPANRLHGRSNEDEISWDRELQKLVEVCKILESADTILKEKHIENIANSVNSLLQSCKGNATPKASRNLHFLDRQFSMDQNVLTILCGSSLYQWATLHTSSYPSQCEHQQEMMEDTSEESIDLSHVFVGRRDNHNDTPRSQPGPSLPPLVAASGPDSLLFKRQQICAKLHCLYGVPVRYIQRNSTTSSRYNLRYNNLPIHPYVRSRVYDLRQHTDGTFWGPFIDDGSQEVDWEKLESIMIIIDHNLNLNKRDAGLYFDHDKYIPAWDEAFAGAYPFSYFSKPCHLPNEPMAPLENQDPYNVTGTWSRVVCYLDYTDLHNFNYPEEQSGQPRPPLDSEEVTRFITMKITVTKIKPPGEDDGQELPVVHFKGISSALRPSWDPNANSKIRGTVRLTPKGEVRWTTISVMHGEERWRSEGIQIGGIQSARGVLGYWFDKDYDLHGPAGPTAFWKCHDCIEERKVID